MTDPEMNVSALKKMSRPILLAATLAGGLVLTGCAAGFDPVVSPLLVADPDFVVGDVTPLIADVAALAFTSVNGLAFADSADLYSMPQRAADVILAERA